MALEPELSVLLPAMLGYEKIRPALDFWIAQTALPRLEILLLIPDKFALTQKQLASLPPGCRAISVGSASLHEARAIGIQHARAGFIAVAEDHCLPDPSWSEVLLERIEEGWDAVGSAMRPGNRENCWSEAAFLAGYGQWMIPLVGGPSSVICGHNVVVRRDSLRSFGDDLATELFIGAFMMKKLHERGCRFYIDAKATMRHFDPPGFFYNIHLMLLVGLGFGAIRTQEWGWSMRILYLFAFPLIALLHLKRVMVNYLRAGRGCRLRVATPFAAAVLVVFWSIGESLGAILPSRWLLAHSWKTEVKPVSDETIMQSNATQARLSNSP